MMLINYFNELKRITEILNWESHTESEKLKEIWYVIYPRKLYPFDKPKSEVIEKATYGADTKEIFMHGDTISSEY